MNFNMLLKAARIGLKTGGKWAVKHLPTILTAVGSIGVAAGTVMAAKKAPEAEKELSKIKAEWEAIPENERQNYSKADYIFKLVRVGTKYYWCVCLVVGGSIACFWIANHINLTRLMAALTAGKLASDRVKDLENEIKGEGGDGKLEKINDKINARKIREHPCDIDPSKLNHVIGETPVFDPVSEGWYATTAENIRRAVLLTKEDLADQLLSGEKYAFVPFNDFREWAGLMRYNLPATAQSFGDKFGFGVMLNDSAKPSDIHDLVDNAISVDLTSAIMDGCIGGLALKYGQPPKYQFDYEGRW